MSPLWLFCLYPWLSDDVLQLVTIVSLWKFMNSSCVSSVFGVNDARTIFFGLSEAYFTSPPCFCFVVCCCVTLCPGVEVLNITTSNTLSNVLSLASCHVITANHVSRDRERCVSHRLWLHGVSGRHVHSGSCRRVKHARSTDCCVSDLVPL